MGNPAIHKVQSVGMEFSKLLEQVNVESYDTKEFGSLMQVLDRVKDDMDEIYSCVEDEDEEGEEDESL